MRLFEFMVSGFYFAVGTVCVCAAAMIVVSAACAIYKIIRDSRRG